MHKVAFYLCFRKGSCGEFEVEVATGCWREWDGLESVALTYTYSQGWRHFSNTLNRDENCVTSKCGVNSGACDLSGHDNWTFLRMLVKKRKSSIRARFSPKQTLGPGKGKEKEISHSDNELIPTPRSIWFSLKMISISL